jgi:hypothetical protein
LIKIKSAGQQARPVSKVVGVGNGGTAFCLKEAGQRSQPQAVSTFRYWYPERIYGFLPKKSRTGDRPYALSLNFAIISETASDFSAERSRMGSDLSLLPVDEESYAAFDTCDEALKQADLKILGQGFKILGQDLKTLIRVL